MELQAGPDETAERLTMAGLEIEGIEDIGDDKVLEVNVTPNRPDCLSVLGVAREASAAFGAPLRMPETLVGDAPGSDFRVEIADPELCNRYAGRLITGVAVKESPGWIKQRLEKYGIRSLNNIVDITNYVLIELGHPLHAFDADKLYDRTIRVARAGVERKFLTLDGERMVPPEALMIWDGREPVAIAGIMGGEESAVTSKTVNVFLESAYFDPVSIRRTSRRMGLRSESSYRFERGTDIEFLEKALNRAALLMKETGGGSIHGIVDAYPRKFVPYRVEVEYGRLKALLGAEVEKGHCLDLLSKIGLRAEDSGERISVCPPPYRRDIQEYFDVVEEVARLYGFGKIPVTLPHTALSGAVNKREENLAIVRNAVLKTGLTEVVNYSFMNPSDLDLLSIPEGDIRRRYIQVRNPLRQEESLMRTTLVPAMINNFLYNISRGMKEIKLFEIARVYFDQGEKLPLEKTRMAGIFYREKEPSLWKEEAHPFYSVKGCLENLFGELKLSGVSYRPSDEIFLHPGKSAEILLKDEAIGSMGELGPATVERLNLKITKPEIVIFEIDLEKIVLAIPEKISFSAIPKYPSIERDIALIVGEEVTADLVIRDIVAFRAEHLVKTELFDAYKGKNIPAGKKSLAFRIIYRAEDRTLTEREVEPVHQALVDYIIGKTGGELRA